MRVVLATYGTRGDVEPMVALAVELRGRGIDVQLCAPPDEVLGEVVGRAGVPVATFERPYRDFQEGLAAEQRVSGVDGFVRAHVAATHPVLDAAVRQGCDVLLATGMLHFVAGAVAEQARVAHRFVVFTDWVLQPMPFHPLVAPALDAFRGSLGIGPVEDPRRSLLTEHPWVAEEPLLRSGAAVPGLDVVHTPAWILEDHRPLAPALDAFLASGPPPVVVGFGSMQVAAGAAQVALAAARAHGRRLVLLSGWADLTLDDDRDDDRGDDRGDDVIVTGEVNQQALFARAAAVIHHGGAGTTLAALRAGAPQLVVGQAADQPDNGRRVAALGVGAVHDGPTPTTKSLTTALGHALRPEVREAALVRAAEVDLGGTARAAALLDTVVDPDAAD